MSKLTMEPKTATVDSASPGAPVRFTWAGLKRSTIFYPFVGLVVVCLVMVFASNSFLSAANIENIARQVSINAIIAVGMTCVILTGGIDLSVGSVMALSGTLAAGLMVSGMNAVAALVVGIAVGLGFGVANGIFVAFAGMPPIIVTLATMGIARGLALIYTGVILTILLGLHLTQVVIEVAFVAVQDLGQHVPVVRRSPGAPSGWEPGGSAGARRRCRRRRRCGRCRGARRRGRPGGRAHG